MLAVVNLVTKFIILAGMLSHCAQPQDLLEAKPYLCTIPVLHHTFAEQLECVFIRSLIYMAQGIAANGPFQYSAIPLIYLHIILIVPTILCVSIN